MSLGRRTLGGNDLDQKRNVGSFASAKAATPRASLLASRGWLVLAELSAQCVDAGRWAGNETLGMVKHECPGDARVLAQKPDPSVTSLEAQVAAAARGVRSGTGDQSYRCARRSFEHLSNTDDAQLKARAVDGERCLPEPLADDDQVGMADQLFVAHRGEHGTTGARQQPQKNAQKKQYRPASRACPQQRASAGGYARDGNHPKRPS